MENLKKGKLIKRIILTIIGMLLCILLINVSVYAALQQSANLTNKITVTTEGQAQAIVQAYQTSLTGNTAVTAMPESEPTWGEAFFTKDETTNEGSKEMAEMIFSETTNKNVYGYKIFVENKSTVPVDVAITSSTESNTQIDVYCGTTYATLTKLDNTAGVNFASEDLAKDGTLTYYIFVCSNVALADMTEQASQTFDVEVNIKVA